MVVRAAAKACHNTVYILLGMATTISQSSQGHEAERSSTTSRKWASVSTPTRAVRSDALEHAAPWPSSPKEELEGFCQADLCPKGDAEASEVVMTNQRWDGPKNYHAIAERHGDPNGELVRASTAWLVVCTADAAQPREIRV